MTDAKDNPSLGYLLLCDDSSIINGKHVFLGVFDRLFAPRFPCVHSKLVIAIEVFGAPEREYTFSLALKDSNESDIIPMLPIGPLRISPFGSANVQVGVEGLSIPHKGFYTFELQHDGEPIGKRQLFVEEIPGSKK